MILEKGLSNRGHMALSVREIKCAHNSASEETEHVCDWCQSIIDFQPQKGWNLSLIHI